MKATFPSDVAILLNLPNRLHTYCVLTGKRNTSDKQKEIHIVVKKKGNTDVLYCCNIAQLAHICILAGTPNCHAFDLQLPIPSNPAEQPTNQSQLMLFLSANQKQRSLLSTNQSAAGSHSTLKLRENKEVGGTERGGGRGAW